jgi:hypothetical protein
MSHEIYEDNRWDANEAARDWEDSERRYDANVNSILVHLTKEQHARLRYLYEEKEMFMKINDDFQSEFYKLDRLSQSQVNYALITEIQTNNYVRAFNAYIEFVSAWPGLCEFYDGR